GARMSYSTKPERFELTLGGTIELRYNQQRAQLDLPWGALAEAELPEDLRDEAREVWTRLAYIEYRSAAGMNAVTEPLIAARAPPPSPRARGRRRSLPRGWGRASGAPASAGGCGARGGGRGGGARSRTITRRAS